MHASVAIAVVLFALEANASPLSELRDWWFGQPWESIQAVGGIKTSDATRLPDGTVAIALECDVSGLKTVSQRPEALNSAIGVAEVLSTAEEHALLLSIRTRMGASSSCPPARFEAVAAGDYQVFYRGSDRQPHEIGRVRVP